MCGVGCWPVWFGYCIYIYIYTYKQFQSLVFSHVIYSLQAARSVTSSLPSTSTKDEKRPDSHSEENELQLTMLPSYDTKPWPGYSEIVPRSEYEIEMEENELEATRSTTSSLPSTSTNYSESYDENIPDCHSKAIELQATILPSYVTKPWPGYSEVVPWSEYDFEREENELEATKKNDTLENTGKCRHLYYIKLYFMSLGILLPRCGFVI